MDSTGILARWRVRPFKFEYDDIHRAGVKSQAAVKLSLLRTTDEGKPVFDCELPVLAVEAPNSYSFDHIKRCVQRRLRSKWSDTAPCRWRTTEQKKIITEQAFDAYCCAATWDIGTPQSELDNDSRGILVQMSFINKSVQIVDCAMSVFSKCNSWQYFMDLHWN